MLTILGRYAMTYGLPPDELRTLEDTLYPPEMKVVDTYLDNVDF